MKPSRPNERASGPAGEGADEARQAEPQDPSGKDAEKGAPAELPDVSSLGKDSDYRPFLERTVAPALRRLALRRLWRSDPAFSKLDGLNEYDEDFASLHREGTEILEAARRAGKRLVSGPKGAREREEEEVVAEADDGTDAAGVEDDVRDPDEEREEESREESAS